MALTQHLEGVRAYWPLIAPVTAEGTINSTLPELSRAQINVALGLLVALGLGLAALGLRGTFDRTVGPRFDPGAIARSPVLGAIPDAADAKSSPLIAPDALSARAVAFRRLRGHLRRLGVGTAVRSLLVTSSWRGEGKSTTAANLAIAFAQGGDRVVLIDADPRHPTAGGLFGLPDGAGLTSVLLGDVTLGDAVRRWREDLRLWVLPSGPLPNPDKVIRSHQMAAVVEQLAAEGHLVIVDSPPLLPATDATVLAGTTDGTLLVVRAKSTRVERLAHAAGALRAAGAPALGVVVTRVPGKHRHQYASERYPQHPRAALPPSVPPPRPGISTPLPDAVILLPDDPAELTVTDRGHRRRHRSS